MARLIFLRHHKKAIRQVKYHPTYPLFASASDDGTVIICHGKVFRFEVILFSCQVQSISQNPSCIRHTKRRIHYWRRCTYYFAWIWIFIKLYVTVTEFFIIISSSVNKYSSCNGTSFFSKAIIFYGNSHIACTYSRQFDGSFKANLLPVSFIFMDCFITV